MDVVSLIRIPFPSLGVEVPRVAALGSKGAAEL